MKRKPQRISARSIIADAMKQLVKGRVKPSVRRARIKKLNELIESWLRQATSPNHE